MIFGFFAFGASQSQASSGKINIEVISSKADRVTGDDALVTVTLAPGLNARKLGIRLNGVGIRSFFGPAASDTRHLTGLVNGFRPGPNRITAWAPGLNAPVTKRVYNSPVTGPVFSGPHQTPYICRSAQNGLGDPIDGNCSAPTRTDYFYKSTGGDILPLADPASRPADMAQTTLPNGRTVDYRIRMESGTINRAVYRWAMLDTGGDLKANWNGRFAYSHGGGCTAGYQQGNANTNLVLDDLYLKRGFAVLTSSLNVMATACNDVLSAETASMVKEHVIESLGQAPEWTIGFGGSGGSMLVQMTAQNYPGLFDGVLPTSSYPDNVLVVQPHCRLLYSYFDSPAAAGLDEAKRTAISGIPVEQACRALGSTTADVINAFNGCASWVPAELIFNPVTNPGGARCTVFDSLVNVYGRDPESGYARRAFDNVGRQYGLKALQAGDLTLEEFLDLNEFIGGFDDNGVDSPQRAAGDVEAIRTAYRTGRINRGGGAAPGVPFIDVRSWVDGFANVHISVPAFEFRERMRNTNGSLANYVMFRARGNPNAPLMKEEAVDAMSEWLDGIKADSSSASLPQKVAANRPARATDACWANDGQRYNEPAEIGQPGVCNDNYPPFSTPDLQAGKPLGSNVLKCQLKPLNQSDYGSPNPTQVARLNAAFPGGVCDWARPGVGDEPLAGTDLSFGPTQTFSNSKRRLNIRVNRQRVRKTRRGQAVRVTASLFPCPAVTWQRVIFERRVKRGKRQVWRRAGSRIVNGNRCQAHTRIRRIRSNTRLRARAVAVDGFMAARSPVRVVRVAGSKRRSGRG